MQPVIAQAQTAGSLYPIEVVPNVSGSSPESLALSPDGNFIAAGEYDGGVKLWDFATGRLLRSFLRHSKRVTSVKFVENGTQIVSASEDMTIKVWETATGKLLRTIELRSPAQYFWDIKLSPDGKRALTAQTIKGTDRAGVAKLWDVSTGRVIRTFRATPMSVAFAPDGTRIVSGGSPIDHRPGGQITLWDATTGRLLRSFDSEKFWSVSKVALSPDGSHIASAGPDVRIWNVASGRFIRIIAKDQTAALIFTPDSKTLLTSDYDDVISMWDVASGRLIRTYKKEGRTSLIWVFPDGVRALASNQGLSLLDLESGKDLRKFGTAYSGIGDAKYSDDGTHLVSRYGGGSTSWNAKTGQLVVNARSQADNTYSASFTRDGSRSAVWRWDVKKIRVVDTASERVLAEIDRPASITKIEISPDGNRVLGGGDTKDGMVLWDASTGKVLRTFQHTSSVNAVAFSPDGARVMSGTSDGNIKLWDAATGQAVWSYKDGPAVAIVWTLEFSLDASRLLATIDQKPKLLDARTGRLIHTFEGHQDLTTYATFSRDASQMMSSSHDQTTRLWDVASGRLLRTFGHSASTIAFSPDGRRALLSGDLYDLATGAKIVGIVGQDNEWLAITPEGYFVASEHGADALSIVNGLEVYSIEQFYQSLYRPDLVREKLAGDPRGLVRDAAANLDLTKALASGNAPVVRIVSPDAGVSTTDGRIVAEVEIEARGGGVGRIEWRINGLTVGVETLTSQPLAGQPVRVARALVLNAGDNFVEVVAYNSINLIASVPARIAVAGPAVAPATPSTEPRLFVLAAGLNDYADRRFRLALAVNDANVLAQAFVEANKGLYRHVEVKVLRDAEVTRDRLDAAFNELVLKIAPTDTFVLYLAGHGKTVDGRYYFVPQNFKVEGELSDAAIDAAVKSQGISQEQWQRWFALVPARRSMILFDTCESGTLTGDESETKALERSGANDRLAQATGRSIITASGGAEAAFEGYNGHGLFTYNVLEALDRADSDGNGTIEVAELAAYVYAQVTSISERVFKQRQEPQMKIAANYALTRQARVLRDTAPVVAMESKPSYQLAQASQIKIQPSAGATVVRSLSAKSAVTVLKSDANWTLIASEGKPLGYVATRDLVPVQ